MKRIHHTPEAILQWPAMTAVQPCSAQPPIVHGRESFLMPDRLQRFIWITLEPWARNPCRWEDHTCHEIRSTAVQRNQRSNAPPGGFQRCHRHRRPADDLSLDAPGPLARTGCSAEDPDVSVVARTYHRPDMPFAEISQGGDGDEPWLHQLRFHRHGCVYRSVTRVGRVLGMPSRDPGGRPDAEKSSRKMGSGSGYSHLQKEVRIAIGTGPDPRVPAWQAHRRAPLTDAAFPCLIESEFSPFGALASWIDVKTTSAAHPCGLIRNSMHRLLKIGASRLRIFRSVSTLRLGLRCCSAMVFRHPWIAAAPKSRRLQRN